MKEYIYKIKDLPKDFNLVGCKLIGKTTGVQWYFGEKVKYIYSGWHRGFWLKDKLDEGSEVKPIFFNDFDEIKDWEVEVPLTRVIEIEADKRKLRSKNEERKV